MTEPRRLQEANERLLANDPQGAFACLRPNLTYPSELGAEDWSEHMELLAQIFKALGADALGPLLEDAAEHPNDVPVLYEAGWALYEESLHDLAATVLGRANRLEPGHTQVLTEFVANLEALHLFAAAAELLESSALVPGEDRRGDPWCSYLLVYNRLMNGDVRLAREWAQRLPHTEDPELRDAIDALKGMLVRALVLESSAELGSTDLTEWHVVLNGCVLLHEAIEGFDDGMHGRYAYVADRAQLIRAGIDTMKAILDSMGYQPTRVVAAPDRASRILAIAAAEVLGLPWEEWTPPMGSPDGLVVVYDLGGTDSTEFLEALREHREHQVLWSHASSWTEPFAYAPDFTTFLYQISRTPWEGGGIRVDPETGDVSTTEADERDEAAIAADIVQAEPEPGRKPIKSLLEIVERCRVLPQAIAPGLNRRWGPRLQQRSGSPVPSARFV